MKHPDAVATLRTVLCERLPEPLAARIGLSAGILQDVAGHAGPALVAALMAAATRQPCSELFAAVMSPQVNARIAEQFAQQVCTTAGLKALEEAGQAFIREAAGVAPGDLGDLIAARSGIPQQAAYVMTCVTAAVLAGVLRHHLLLEQGREVELAQLLAAQWPAVEAGLGDALAQLLRYDDAAAFRDTVPAQLRVLCGTLQRAATPAQQEESGPAAAPAAVAKPRRRAGRAALVLVPVVVLAAGYYGLNAFRHASPRSAAPVEGAVLKALPQPAAPSPASAPAPASMATDFTQPGSAPPAAAPATPSGPQASPPASASGAAGVASSPVAAAPGAADPPPHRSRLEFGVNRVGTVLVSATVAGEAQRSQLLSALERSVGAGHYTADVVIDPGAGEAGWLAHVDALAPLMRVVRADLTIDGHDIELGGAAAQPGAGWVSRVREIFGGDYRVQVFDPAAAVAEATAAFGQAMDRQMQAASCEAVERVLNLQVVDFAHGSAHVPASARASLTRSAQLLSGCAARGHTAGLTIEAYSDSMGDAQANLALCAKRAAAVRAFLVQAGVPAASLASRGYGAQQPLASNATGRGRFRNRRIVFVTQPSP